MVVLGGWYVFQTALLGPAPNLAVADLAPAIQGRPVGEVIWSHNRFRGEGEGEGEMDLNRQSFQVGALLVDSRLSARAGDVGNASETWRSIGSVLDKVGFMKGESVLIWAQANQMNDAASLRRVAATAEATERRLGDPERSVLTSEYLDFGKWTEAGRVAALTRDAAFFKDRKNRRFLAYSLRNKEIQPSLEVRRELQDIARIWDKGKLGSAEFASLTKHFQNILNQYDFTA
jgi:hypothetical protein